MVQYVCNRCGTETAPQGANYMCECGGLWDLAFDAAFPVHKIVRRPPTLWRYREAIPIARQTHPVTFGEGFTPLVPLTLGKAGVLVKLDHVFPTGSYKDRGATVLMSYAREQGVTDVVEDSSGNAGCAISAYAAAASMGCKILVPEATSPAKLAQISAYGARLVRVPGDRQATARAALAAAQRSFYASHTYNPFFFHGTKTFAFEVVEQLGWRAPDTVVVPAGNGTLLLGCAIGFRELAKAGLIDRLPRLVAVQAAACAPLLGPWAREEVEVDAVEAEPTQAEGIAICNPPRGRQMLAELRACDGEVVAVEEAEIASMQVELARMGHYVEPTAAATLVGVRNWLEGSERTGTVVTTFTGHGLKHSH